MPLISGWIPPTREHYDLVCKAFLFVFPFVGCLQWGIKWYGMGKTSVSSRYFNIPGRVAWMTMECPGFLTLLYIMNTLPKQHDIHDLPWQNRVLGGLFVIHYSYRAVAFPLLQPSVAPIHVLVWALALCFQLLNGICIGSWLAAYGPTTEAEWAAQSSLPQFVIGMAIFYIGLSANFFHDEELREIRRREQIRQERIHAEQKGKPGAKPAGIEKHYQIPQAGLFKYMLYPHYFCEWVEWTGFLIAAGFSCGPAWAFLLNELTSMLPRAVNGKKWYVEKFGEDKVGKKWAVLPGIC